MPDPYSDVPETDDAFSNPKRRPWYTDPRRTSAYKGAQSSFRDECRRHRNPDGTYGLPCWQCQRAIDYRLAGPHPASFSLDHALPIRSHPQLALTPSNFRAAHLRCNQQRRGELDSDSDLDLGEASEVW